MSINIRDLDPLIQQDSLIIDFVTKIIRKPVPVGMEFRTISDNNTGIIHGLELQEGKDSNFPNPFLQEANGAAGTASFLNLASHSMDQAERNGLQNLYIMDSAFASVNSVECAAKRGHFCLGLVKTATKKSPKKAAEEMNLEKGEHLTFTATLPFGPASRNIIAVSWQDMKRKLYVGNVGDSKNGIDLF